mgnify:CR=1 FL=1
MKIAYCKNKEVANRLISKGMSLLKKEGEYYVLSNDENNNINYEEFEGEVFFTDSLYYID